MKRGQLLSIDFFVALAAIIFVLLILLLSWQTISRDGSSYVEQADLDKLIHKTSIALLSQSGYPHHWHNISNASNIQSIGLLEPGTTLLSMDRLHALNRSDMSHADVREKIGVQGVGTYFFITVSEGDSLIFTHGDLPQFTSKTVSVRSYYVYNESALLSITMGVWK